MLPELGTFLLVLALLVALVQAVVPLAGAQRGRSSWMAVARPAAMVQLALIASAFAVLTHAFLVQDFFRCVTWPKNSNSLLPMMYRYSAVWGAHEGSLLLWTLVLALWTGAVAIWSRQLPAHVIARVLGVMALVSIGFLAFFCCSPPTRLRGCFRCRWKVATSIRYCRIRG